MWKNTPGDKGNYLSLLKNTPSINNNCSARYEKKSAEAGETERIKVLWRRIEFHIVKCIGTWIELDSPNSKLYNIANLDCKFHFEWMYPLGVTGNKQNKLDQLKRELIRLTTKNNLKQQPSNTFNESTLA